MGCDVELMRWDSGLPTHVHLDDNQLIGSDDVELPQDALL